MVGESTLLFTTIASGFLDLYQKESTDYIRDREMTREEEFLKDFEAWVSTQIMVNEMAVEESRRVLEEDKDQRAADAYIRYESKLDAYRFIQTKFANFHNGKGFHDLPEGLFGERRY